MVRPRWDVSKTSRLWGGCLVASWGPDRKQLLLIHHLTAASEYAECREINGVPSGQKRRRREGMTRLPQTHGPVHPFLRPANQPRHCGDIMITVTKELYSSPTSAELRGWKRPENIGRMPKSVPSSTDCNIELIQYLSLLDIMRDLWFWCQS